MVEKIEDNLYAVEIKNKLSIGDRLEILRPDTIEEASFNIEELYDIKNGKPIDTINPGIKGQQVKMKIPFDLVNGTVIRRKR